MTTTEPLRPDPAIRSIHLQGGCRANDVKGWSLSCSHPNGEVAQLTAANFYHAYAALRDAGFLIIGADFYFELEQVDGRRLPSWRAYHRVGATSWPCAEQADQWSFIAHSAFRVQNGLLWDVASRVSYQMRVCDWRLRQVSESYRDQLHATVRSREFDEGRRFQDGFTWLGYLAIHAFLVDACILRDYLCEYRALLLTQSGARKFRGKITRMGSLKKHFLSKDSLTAPIDQAMNQASDPGGWLHLLGNYRDLVVHYAPLANAGHDLYALCETIPFQGQITLPAIKLPSLPIRTKSPLAAHREHISKIRTKTMPVSSTHSRIRHRLSTAFSMHTQRWATLLRWRRHSPRYHQ